MVSPNIPVIDKASESLDVVGSWSDSLRELKEDRDAVRLRSGNAVEAALWVAAVALLSPLLVYYGAATMPLVALFGIAGGIALGLALAGRRLHASLLQDALSGRSDKGRFLMTVGMSLLVLFLVLLGSVVALTLLLRSFAPKVPV